MEEEEKKNNKNRRKKKWNKIKVLKQGENGRERRSTDTKRKIELGEELMN